MTEDVQRIAMEEACGWEYDSSTEEMIFTQGGDICGVPWPSLDAMHEAEKILTIDQQGEYARNLRAVCGTTGVWSKDSAATLNWFWHATATQRAEAFLRTLGKWDDSL